MVGPNAPEDGGLEFLTELPRVPEPSGRNRLQITLQILAVPLAITAISAGIFVLFSFMTQSTMSAEELLNRIRTTAGQPRRVYANEFVNVVRRARGEFEKEPPAELLRLVGPLLAALESLSSEGRPADPQEVEIKKQLILSLGIIQDKTSGQSLARLMRAERDEGVVGEYLQALGAIRDRGSGPAILEKLRDASPYVRKYAAFNLASLKDPAHLAGLQAALQDDSVEVRWNAAFGLAYFHGDASGAPVLRGLLDPAAIPRDDAMYASLRAHAVRMACKGLAVVKDRAALSNMKEMSVSDPDPEVRAACRQAVRIIEEQP